MANTNDLNKLSGNPAALNAKKDFDSLMNLAKNGDANSQYLLAMHYYQGYVVANTEITEKNLDKALEWFKLSSLQGHAQATEKMKKCSADKAKQLENNAFEKFQQAIKETEAKREETLKKAKIAAAAAKNEFESLVQFANSGNADAQYLLGMHYYNGYTFEDKVIAEKNLDKALEWFKKSSLQNHAEATEKMKKCSADKAKQLENDAFEKFQNAIKETEAKREEKLKKAKIAAAAARNEFDSLVQFAISGNSEAQYLLGMHYYKGYSVENTEIAEKNLDKALEWLKKSSLQGHNEATDMLSKCSVEKAKQIENEVFEELQRSIKETEAKREEKLKKAKIVAAAAKNEFDSLVQFAESGNADAQYLLGLHYYEGYLIEDTVIAEKSLDKALELFKKSSLQGHAEASEKMEKLSVEKAKQLEAEEFEKFQKAIRETEAKREAKLKKAKIAAAAAKNEFDSLVQFAQTGNADAQYMLGNVYYEGKTVEDIVVVEIDVNLAIDWFSKSAENGNQQAKEKALNYKVEKRLKENKLALENAKKELKTLEQLLESGNADAFYYMGKHFYDSLIVGGIKLVDNDLKKAMEYFEIAHNHGNSDAMEMYLVCKETLQNN